MSTRSVLRRVWRLAAGFVLLAAVMLPAPALAESSSRIINSGIGLFDGDRGDWYLRDSDGQTAAFPFGEAGDIPIVGDWDGDGVDTPGVYDPDTGWVTLRNWIEDPPPPRVYRTHGGWLDLIGIKAEFTLDVVHRLPPGGTPVVADPDGDGVDAISIALGRHLHVMNGLPGKTAPVFAVETALEMPANARGAIAGDFDGDGNDEFAARLGDQLIGLGDAAGLVDVEVGFGVLVSGDWDSDGIETPGAYDSLRAEFAFLHGSSGAPERQSLELGSTGMMGVAGSFGSLSGADDPPPRMVGLPAMEIGDEGRSVAVLQEELRRRGLYRGPIDGRYGLETGYAVVAFHKVLDLDRVYEWRPSDTVRLGDFQLPDLPVRPDEPDRVEVDIGRQVLLVYEDHEVTAIVPVSTGGSYLYYSPRNDAVVAAGTPRGDFTLFHIARGWHCDPLTGWCIYNPWSFTPYYALHGYGSVPSYPASHGCVRVTTWDSDILTDEFLFVGIPIHIWDFYDPSDPEV